VTAISTSNVWAVGYVGNTTVPIFQTLIEHWDGSKWSTIPSQNPGTYTDQLYGVAASSATDIWAVGVQGDSPSGALIEHWIGTTWQVSPNPLSPPSLAFLQAISVISSTDVWAVGKYHDNTGDHTLAEHWNGTNWQVVSTPDGSQNGRDLNAVTAISSSNVWAVGSYQNPIGTNLLTLIEHWDGTSWTISASPDPGGGDNVRNAVIATGSSSVWAAGSYFDPASGDALTLLEQWNGSSWNVVYSASLGIGNSSLAGLANVGGQVWAVGDWLDSSYLDETLVEVHLTFPMLGLSSPRVLAARR
jgi:hypothetical protein